MSTSQITLYNGALRVLGQPKLSTLSDDVEHRYLLDGVWDENAREYVLEQGNWNFATRSIKSEYDSSVSEPDFGFQKAFSKPTDWLKTVQLASDEYFQCPLPDDGFSDEQGYWWSDLETLYIRYISNDSSYGYDLSLWPQAFCRYVECYLALQIAPRVLQTSTEVEKIEKKLKVLHIDALSKDALNEGTKRWPGGSWTRARRSKTSFGDMGSRRRLTG